MILYEHLLLLITGLYESAANTGAWIVSGGQNVGAMKEVGKARRQYSSAFGDIGRGYKHHFINK